LDHDLRQGIGHVGKFVRGADITRGVNRSIRGPQMIIHAHAGGGIEIDPGRFQAQAFYVRGPPHAHEDFIDTQFLPPALCSVA